MYFRNVVCTVALATLASAAVAKQIPTPYSTNEAFEDSIDDEVFERDAEAEAARTATWEEAHGGAAPSYHYGEAHDAAAWHVARDAEAEPGWKHGGANPAWLEHLKSKATQATDAVKNAVPTAKPFTKQSGGLNKHHGSHKLQGNHGKHTRDFEEDDDDDEFENDPDDILYARDFDDDPIPDFGDQEVDTSLEGLLEARDVDVSEDEEDLTGYDEEILQRRSDGTADEIDYSLEGYDLDQEDDEELSPLIQARSLNEDEQYDEYLRSEEHRSLLESIGVTKRDAEDDAQDEAEFDEELYITQQDSDFISEDPADYEKLAAHDLVDDDVAEYDIDEEGDFDDEDLKDDEDVDADADAAYDGAEVVEELVAPVLGERDASSTATASSRGFFRIPW